MASTAEAASQLSETELQDLVIEADSGARKPKGLALWLAFTVALVWSLFQLWIVSPLPYTHFANEVLGIPIFPSTESRYFHLSCAFILAFITYPAFKHSPRSYVPQADWIYAFLSAITVGYLYMYKNELALRAGLPTDVDVLVATVGVVLLLEAARRALGPALMICSAIFLFYIFTGSASFMPDLIAHKGQSLAKVASHQWLSTEGVFGVALGVSADFVFLYVLFGSLLDQAGAGNYLIRLSFALMGHMRGGPAKVAVLSSCLMGTISGSSIANVVAGGMFTIPLMRRTGFSREKAGAVEVAASVDGQIMPPVMGAAAFLMVEFIGIPYSEVVKAAFLPAVLSYVALLYIVHLEALKLGIKPIPKAFKQSFFHRMLMLGITVSSFLVLSGIVYYGLGWLKTVLGDNAIYAIIALSVITYIGLLWYSSMFPPLEMDDPSAPVLTVPGTWETFRTGMHFIIPIVILIWCLMVERMSPGLSAFWSVVCLMVILLTQRPLQAFFRKQADIKAQVKNGAMELVMGLVTGARNMTGIAVATATAGIIVGAISLTGIGQILTELVEVLSGGSFFLVLLFTAVICLVLGMGLPTTASYIIVASLMAPVVTELSIQNGIVVPLIAIHMFVFYFGIMADVTPPVGLASFAAAAISGGEPVRTGLQAFSYSLRTLILPFFFIYNTDFLLIGVDSLSEGLFIALKGGVAMILFSAALMGYFVVKSKWHETVLLLLLSLIILRPALIVDVITPKYHIEDPRRIEKVVEQLPEGTKLKVEVKGIDDIGDPEKFFRQIEMVGDGASGKRLQKYGLTLETSGPSVVVKNVKYNSKAAKDGFDFDFEIVSLYVPQQQMSRNWIYLVALIATVGVIFVQRGRKSEILSVEND